MTEKAFGKKQATPEFPHITKSSGRKTNFWERRSSLIVLIILGGLTIVSLTMPVVMLVLMFTLVGIPLALAIAIAPSILTIYCPSYFSARYIGGWRGASIGALLSSLLLAVPPTFENRAQVKIASDLTVGDHSSLGNLTKPKVIAVKKQLASYEREAINTCDDFCLRALITKEADRFLIFYEQGYNEGVDPTQKAVSYRIEARTKCPATPLTEGLGALQIEGEQLWGANRVSATAAMNVFIARGDCLIQETSKVGTADMVVSNAIMRRGRSAADAGWEIGADTIRAERLQVHVRDGDSFRETYRWTGVRVELLLPMLLPGPIIDSLYSFKNGFYRWQRNWNISSPYYEGPDWSLFLTKTVGLNLKLSPDDTKIQTHELLQKTLSQSGELPAIAQKLFKDIIANVVHSQKSTEKDKIAFLAFLNDPRTKIPYDINNIVAYSDKSDVAWLMEGAAALFKRLRAMPVGAGGHGDSIYHAQIEGLSSAIANMPAGIMQTHAADLKWLAKQNHMRISAFKALAQLGALGTEGTTTLFYLLDIATAAKARPTNPPTLGFYEWQHNYLAAILGICKGGASMKAALPSFISRFKSGEVVVTDGSYWKLAMHTLIALGAEDSLIDELLRKTSPFTRPEHFDSTLKGARQRPECSW